MAQTWRMAVIVASDGTLTGGVFPLAAAKALMETDAYSAKRYWADQTYGAVALEFEYFTATFDPAAVRRAHPEEKFDRYRNLVATGVIDALGSTIDWTRFASFTVLINGSLVDSGSSGIKAGGKSLNYTVHATRWENSRSFLLHEVGHQLDFAHSYGVFTDNTQIDVNKPATFPDHVYGAPNDIMSAQTWGGASPTFDVPDPASYPPSYDENAGPHAHSLRVGPSLSRPLLHHHHLAWFPSDKVQTLAMTRADQSTFAELVPALSGRSGPELLIVDPPKRADGSAGDRIYVEYRKGLGGAVTGQPSEWDRGLSTPPSGTVSDAEPGIVVYTLTTRDHMGTAIWWRGVIPIPVGIDTDLRIDDSGYRVSVRGLTADGKASVWIGPDVPASANVVRTDSYTPKGLRQVPPPVTVDHGRCGTLQSGAWIYETTSVFDVSAVGIGGSGRTGLDSPSAPQRASVTWQVGEQTIPPTHPSSMTLTVSAGAQSFAVTYSRASNGDLTLVAQGIGPALRIPVSVSVTDAGGLTVSAASEFVLHADYIGERPDQLLQMTLCKLGGLNAEIDTSALPEIFRLEHPDWLKGVDITDLNVQPEIFARDVGELSKAVAGIAKGQEANSSRVPHLDRDVDSTHVDSQRVGDLLREISINKDRLLSAQSPIARGGRTIRVSRLGGIDTSSAGKLSAPE